MFRALFFALVLSFAGPALAYDEPRPLAEIDMRDGIPVPGAYDKCGPPTFLDIAASGTLRFRGRTIALSGLSKALAGMDPEDICNRIFIRPNIDTPNAEVIRVITALKYNGFTRIGLIDPTAN